MATSKNTKPKAEKATTTKAPAGDGLRWPEGVKMCPTCKRSKPRSEFASNASARDGAYYACKDCGKIARARQLAARKARGGAPVKASPAPAAKVSKPKAAPSASPETFKSTKLPGEEFTSREAMKAAVAAKAEEFNPVPDGLKATVVSTGKPRAEVPAAPKPKAKRSWKAPVKA
jgi:hypothetical protein